MLTLLNQLSLILFSSLMIANAVAKSGRHDPERLPIGNDKPWFTGALLNNGAITVNKDQWSNFTAFFNNQTPQFQQWAAYTQNVYGITDDLSIQLIPVYANNVEGPIHKNGWGDFPTILAYQIYRQKRGSAMPSIKLNIQEIWPTGRYKGLENDTDAVDGLGQGVNQTGFVLNTEYLFLPIPDHYLNAYFSFGYSFLHPTHLTGLNVYGGGVGTDGRLKGSHQAVVNGAWEFQWTQNWVTVFEYFYQYTQAASFQGVLGRKLDGTTASVLRQGTNQWSLAPALEYNFSGSFGIVSGVWFSLNQRSQKFVNIQIALFYTKKDLL